MFLARDRVTQNEKCKFLLIKDTSHKSARHLMQALALSYSKDSTKVRYFNYDLPRERIAKRFGIVDSNFELLDAFSDPFHSDSFTDSLDFLSCDIFRRLCSAQKSAVFLDSLYYLLSENSAQSLYRSIHRFMSNGSNNAQLVALLHADSHKREDVFIIESLATTVFELLPTSSEEDSYCLRCVIRHASGKVTQEILECQIDEGGKFTKMNEIQPHLAVCVPPKRPDPTANLTFNLKLNDIERENRDKLQLPYTKIQAENPPTTISDIFCEDDFYDEEDPDDDLDI